MVHKHGGGISAVFLKGFYKPPSGILINGGILEEVLSNDPAVHKTGRRNKLHIHLNALAGMVHLLIRLRDILRVRRMDGHDTLPAEEPVKPGNGAGVAALHEFYPENDETSIRVAPAHIEDEFDFLRGVLVRVVMRSARVVTERLNGAIKAPFPAVDVLPVGFVFDGSFGNTIFLSIFNKR